jgi:aspartate-semialdehyde dehydrogenase
MTDSRLPVAILGATGAVGQTFVRLLADHPWFRLAEVAASDRSAGKRYEDATKWIEGTMPEEVKDLVVTTCDPSQVTSKVVFSAMDAVAAADGRAGLRGRRPLRAQQHQDLPDDRRRAAGHP